MMNIQREHETTHHGGQVWDCLGPHIHYGIIVVIKAKRHRQINSNPLAYPPLCENHTLNSYNCATTQTLLVLALVGQSPDNS